MILPSGFSPLRMRRVASKPSITGICTSIRIMSYSPGFTLAKASTIS